MLTNDIVSFEQLGPDQHVHPHRVTQITESLDTVDFIIAPDKKGYPHNIFSYFLTKTYVVGTH